MNTEENEMTDDEKAEYIQWRRRSGRNIASAVCGKLYGVSSGAGVAKLMWLGGDSTRIGAMFGQSNLTKGPKKWEICTLIPQKKKKDEDEGDPNYTDSEIKALDELQGNKYTRKKYLRAQYVLLFEVASKIYCNRYGIDSEDGLLPTLSSAIDVLKNEFSSALLENPRSNKVKNKLQADIKNIQTVIDEIKKYKGDDRECYALNALYYLIKAVVTWIDYGRFSFDLNTVSPLTTIKNEEEELQKLIEVKLNHLITIVNNTDFDCKHIIFGINDGICGAIFDFNKEDNLIYILEHKSPWKISDIKDTEYDVRFNQLTIKIGDDTKIIFQQLPDSRITIDIKTSVRKGIADCIVDINYNDSWYSDESRKTRNQLASFIDVKRAEIYPDETIALFGYNIFNSQPNYEIADKQSHVRPYSHCHDSVIEEVKFPYNLREIGENSFKMCENLKRISFSGREDQIFNVSGKEYSLHELTMKWLDAEYERYIHKTNINTTANARNNELIIKFANDECTNDEANTGETIVFDNLETMITMIDSYRQVTGNVITLTDAIFTFCKSLAYVDMDRPAVINTSAFQGCFNLKEIHMNHGCLFIVNENVKFSPWHLERIIFENDGYILLTPDENAGHRKCDFIKWLAKVKVCAPENGRIHQFCIENNLNFEAI